MVFALPVQAQLTGQVDYAKASRELDINGRTIPLKFGAALVGYQNQFLNGWSVSGGLGRGYDPEVRTSLLSAEASGPAVCDVVQLGVDSPSLHIGQWAVNATVHYRLQRLAGRLTGSYEDGPFRGEVIVRTHYLTPMMELERRFESGRKAAFEIGLMRWNLWYQAYGEVDRAKIWTQSRVDGWGPFVSLTAEIDLTSFRLRGQIHAYRLDADNKVWVPGISVAILK